MTLTKIFKCRNCHRENEKLECLRCGFCGNCGCVCRECEICRNLYPITKSTHCERCHSCRKCCYCRKMPHFIPQHRLGAKFGTFNLNSLPRLLGIELEISEWKNLPHERFKYLGYQTAHDWSVQPSGQEMVIAPMNGDAFIKGMIELAEKIYTSGAKFNQTCALHVHVDGTNMLYWDIRRLLRIYARIEGDIYDYLILPHRRDIPTVTHYCQMMTRRHEYCDRCARFDDQYPQQRRQLPMLNSMLRALNTAKSNTDLKAMVLEMLYNLNPMPQAARTQNRLVPGRYEELQTRKGGRYEWCRYVGLNLHAWQYRGTIEWRMKEGTGEFEELLAWPLWCGWITHAATIMSEADSMDEKMTLLPLTDRYCPRWITDWVEKKIHTGPTKKVDHTQPEPISEPTRPATLNRVRRTLHQRTAGNAVTGTYFGWNTANPEFLIREDQDHATANLTQEELHRIYNTTRQQNLPPTPPRVIDPTDPDDR